MNIRSEYARLRRVGWSAKEALRGAKALALFDTLGGEVIADCDATNDPGSVRVLVVPDYNYDDSYIDTWEPGEICTVGHTQMNREAFRKWLWDKIESEGVWGIQGQYWDGFQWEHVDSVYGFVGDDFVDSGYDHDVMAATCAAFMNHERAKEHALTFWATL